MTVVQTHHDFSALSAARADLHVQLYSANGRTPHIGTTVKQGVRRLAAPVSVTSFDFLSIALAVTAADTFVKREHCVDGWSRLIELHVPLADPAPWSAVREDLERTLLFLSGDVWRLDFTGGGVEPPRPYPKGGRARTCNLEGISTVALFSGGLDSAIRAVDLSAEGQNVLLASHRYPADSPFQARTLANLPTPLTSFALNADPKGKGLGSELTMRTRSLNFLAFGAVACSAIANENHLLEIPLEIPENGVIALNPPLTSRRLGAHSTRTAHPHFLSSLSTVLARAGVVGTIANPFAYSTKGEALRACRDKTAAQGVVASTVSCSNWKRKRQQCGRCVPCIIRRSAIHAAGMSGHDARYQAQDLQAVRKDERLRDDLFAVLLALARDTSEHAAWVAESGPLPMGPERERLMAVFGRGLEEIRSFLRSEKVIS